jgi:hypothetical protein
MLLNVDELSVRQCSDQPMVPDKRIGIFRQYAGYRGTYAFIVNQIASATMNTTIVAQTTGVPFFELPLRGESFGAWL